MGVACWVCAEAGWEGIDAPGGVFAVVNIRTIGTKNTMANITLYKDHSLHDNNNTVITKTT